MKEYYISEVERVSQKLSKYRNCFKFAIVADSHIDNSIQDTFSNIKEVHKNVNFNCLVHLGDFLNGNLPKHYTKAVLKDQMDGFRSSVGGKCFYPVQGNHDGFCDLTKSGGISANIALDEDWYEATKCVNNAKCDNVRYADDRALQTVNQDCWDAVVLKQKERKVYIYRFGWGEDRVLEY